MSQFKMPSPEELEDEYGPWVRNPVLKAAGNWSAERGTDETFNPENSLKHVEKVNQTLQDLREEDNAKKYTK